ncbi:YmaF family protein [Fictibacillus iocasae]|uniref:YmaF family protein n=1 Tax=Fictibacillus iocasae TaxID=2715437 RepID=A0ABW2NS20_9BACL
MDKRLERRLYWQQQAPHIHKFQSITSGGSDHTHELAISTSPMVGGMDDHIHYFEGECKGKDGHCHTFKGYTSSPIPLRGGGHYHLVSAQLTEVSGHTHSFHGKTTNRL